QIQSFAHTAHDGAVWSDPLREGSRAAIGSSGELLRYLVGNAVLTRKFHEAHNGTPDCRPYLQWMRRQVDDAASGVQISTLCAATVFLKDSLAVAQSTMSTFQGRSDMLNSSASAARVSSVSGCGLMMARSRSE